MTIFILKKFPTPVRYVAANGTEHQTDGNEETPAIVHRDGTVEVVTLCGKTIVVSDVPIKKYCQICTKAARGHNRVRRLTR